MSTTPWFNGLPYEYINGDGTMQHWFNGLPYQGVEPIAPPPSGNIAIFTFGDNMMMVVL
jgi:hypothetical protein